MDFFERLNSGQHLVGDGAMGTMLFQRGLKPGDCPEQMNLDHPEVLSEIAKLYFDAGADIIQTNTFGGSEIKLAQYGLQDRLDEITRNAVRAVRGVIGGYALLSGSCGPCGGLLEPHGDLSAARVYESFKWQIWCLIHNGVDVICVETMTDLQEAILAIKAAKEIDSKFPVMATMTFDATPRGFFTIMGVTIEQACKGLADAGADVIGSNCGNGIENMISIAAEFKKHTELPLIIQSNAGLPAMVDGELVYPETPKFMADKSRQLLDIGVNIIGGCCGTTPEHIEAIARVVARHNG
jgi:5-methyltetrahydrofolate--homocysteine methyltransferase